jgi:large subunit ribosomal protein L21
MAAVCRGFTRAWARGSLILCGKIALEVENFMYAVIESGGKQYRVEKGTVIRVEKLDLPEGGKVVFDRVLMAGNEGRIYAGPEADKVKVEGTVVRQGKARKIVVFKYKPKKGYHRKRGHRQLFTEVRVDKISGGPRASRASKPKKEAEAIEPEVKEEAVAEEAAAREAERAREEAKPEAEAAKEKAAGEKAPARKKAAKKAEEPSKKEEPQEG